MNKSLPAIAMKEITKTYARGAQPALRHIELQIAQGERVGLIGANGSGKTTLLRLLMNFVLPDRGSIYIMGEALLEKARRYLGFVPERQDGMENFTPRELLAISARMYGMSRNQAEQRIEQLLEFANLKETGNTLLSDFSKGMLQRIHICIALIHHPPILLLDEPLSGLDPAGQKDVQKMLLQLSGITMIYASHHLEEIETLCTSVIIMHQGEIMRRVNLEDIRQEVFTLDLDSSARSCLSKFEMLKPEILLQDGERIRLQFTADSETVQKLVGELNQEQIPVKRLRSRSILEELYYRYVQSAKPS